MKKKKKNTKIIQGGFREIGSRESDIILSLPEIFLFDMNSYMTSVKSAMDIDYSNRAKLYDLYDSALLDLHLAGVLEKRLRGVTRIPIEFQRDNQPDDNINTQLRAPWFKDFCRDIILAKFYGFTVVQLYLDDGNINYECINRKHFNPIRKEILKYEFDQDGVQMDDFPGMVFVGKDRYLGILADLIPAVLYKRGNISDWARFCNVFGIPIREYTYDAGDEEARKRLIADAKKQGSNAVYIHPRESDLRLIEASNKTGSSELYSTFTSYFDKEISVRVLGNTLTTDVGKTGTQALGKVHKQEECEMTQDDISYILDVLNYTVRPVFETLGFNLQGGEFVLKQHDTVNPQDQIVIIEKLHQLGLPLDDDYLYETFKVQKPDNYEIQKADKAAQKEAVIQKLQSNNDQSSFKQRLMSFFGIAPLNGAESDF